MDNEAAAAVQREEEMLKEHHEACFAALQLTARALREAKLPFFLIEGSALGAVRHRGIIPWDDDIDIAVFRKDFRRAGALLTEVFSGPAAGPFRYADRFNMPDFPRLIGKILDARSGEACIDVFPLCVTSADAAGRQKQWAKRKLLFKLYKAKIGYANAREREGVKNRLKLLTAKLTSLPFTKEGILRRIEQNETRFETAEAPVYYINLYGAYDAERESLRAEWLTSPSVLSFCGEDFPSVGDPDAYLINLYGDYMKIPDEAERRGRHGEAFSVDGEA